MRRRLVALLAVGVSASLAACGGGDGSAAPPTTFFVTTPTAPGSPDEESLPAITTTTGPGTVVPDTLAFSGSAPRVTVTTSSTRTAKVESSQSSQPATSVTNAPASVLLAAAMTGAEETPTPGDLRGSGTASITVDRGAGRVCFEVAVKDLVSDPTSAHLHRGVKGSSGDIVVGLQAPPRDGRSKGCTAVDAKVLSDLEQSPEAFYVNVHSQAHPSGAVRGQLHR